MGRTPSADPSWAIRGVGESTPFNHQMSGTGSSGLINPTSSEPHCPQVTAAGDVRGGSTNTPVPSTLVTDSNLAPPGSAGPAHFPISPPSISSNPELVGSSKVHQEQQGQQNQSAPAPPENDSLLNKRNVELNQNNYVQPQLSGGAGPVQILTLPPSCSSNPVLVGPNNLHSEQQGYQSQAGPLLAENDNRLKRQKVEQNQNNSFQPQVLESSASQNHQAQAFSDPQGVTTHHHQQMRQNAGQLALPPRTPNVRPPFVKGICARRLVQYMDDQRSRPADNPSSYWEQFVKNYYSPRAKIMWCLSSYGNMGNRAHGIFPHKDVEALPCDLCHLKSGKGFEVKIEILHRLDKIKFDNDLIDELLFLDAPNETQLRSGIMILECKKAVLESIYDKFRVVHTGLLRVSFTPELKILNWEFCVQRHNQYILQRYVSSQVNQLMRVGQRYLFFVDGSDPVEVSHDNLATCCNMFWQAAHQVGKSLQPHSLNEWGFSKSYVRSLQVSQVVNSLKDLIDYSWEHNVGPIEGLKNYSKQAAAAPEPQKMQMQRLLAVQSMHSTDQNNPQHVGAAFQSQMAQLQQPMPAQSLRSVDQNRPQHVAAAFQAQMGQLQQPMPAQSLYSMDQINRGNMIAHQHGAMDPNLNNSQRGTATISGSSAAAKLNSWQNLVGSSSNPNQTTIQVYRPCNDSSPNPSLAHISALADNSVNDSSFLQQNKQQHSETVDEQKVIQMMLEELQKNEAMEQQASGSTSKVIAPTEVCGGGGGIESLPTMTNAELIGNETKVDPLGVNLSNDIEDSEPPASNNFEDIGSFFNSLDLAELNDIL